jgi:hypothetical protein
MTNQAEAEAEKTIQAIASAMKHTVETAVKSIASLDTLAGAFSDIDRAFEEVIDVLDQMNERLARLEARESEDKS